MRPPPSSGLFDGSAVTESRVVSAAFLGRRFASCLTETERVAVSAEHARRGTHRRLRRESHLPRSLAGRHLQSCDGGSDPTGERRPPWCGRSVGRLYGGRLLDPRLDILCRDRDGRRLAYAWVEPVAGSHWIGVDQGSYTEMYEVAAGLPVRIATRRGIDEDAATATFELTQYGVHGRELLRSSLEAAVAG